MDGRGLMGGFRLGSVLGFEIRIDPSWFVLFFLIVWSFSGAVFPAQYPGYGSGAYLAMGVAAALLLFASLLAHELSHSVVARAKGIPVEGITLFIFGGVARTRLESERAGDEFLIAAAGPAASVAIALGFLAIGRWGPAVGVGELVAGIASYLGVLNLVLAVFNLLPGFPLDGGRLLRATVWRITGDLTRATRWATNAGRWLAYLIMAVGVAQAMLLGNLIGGMWLVFIGWFLKRAADGAYRQHRIRMRLERARAGEAARHVPTVPVELSVAELVDGFFLRRPARTFIVTEAGRPVGTVDIEQIRDMAEAEWPARSVRDTMRPAGSLVDPGERMLAVLHRVQDSEAPVVVASDARLYGIIGPRELAPWLQASEDDEGGTPRTAA